MLNQVQMKEDEGEWKNIYIPKFNVQFGLLYGDHGHGHIFFPDTF